MTSETGLIDIDSAVTSQTGNVNATADKDLTINGAVTAKNGVTLLSKNASVTVNDAITAQGGNVKATAKTGLTVDGAVQGYKNLELATDAGGITVNKQVASSTGDISMNAAAGNIDVGAEVKSDQGNISITAGEGLIEIGDTVQATQGNVTVHVDKGMTSTDGEGNKVVDAISVGGNVKAGQTVSLTAGEGSIGVGVGATSEQGKVDAVGDITIRSDKGEIDIYNTVTSTGGNISISNGEEAIYIQGAVTASGNVDLTSEAGLIDIDSAVTSQTGDISATAQDNLTIDGAVTAKNDVTLDTDAGGITVNKQVTSSTGDISMTATAGNIDVGAAVKSSEGDVSLQTGNGNIFVSGDITVGANKDALLEAEKGSIFVGTFTDDGQTVSANGSIGAADGNTAGTVTVKTGEGTIDILKSITSTNIDVENGDGDIVIGINKASDETVTAKENISLVTKQGQIEIYGKTSTEAGDITMKAAAASYNNANPESAFIIGQYGEVASGRDITLEGRNGDIHVTDNITAQRNVNAVIKDKGSLYFDDNLSTDGAITANVAEGNIEVGAAVTSGEGDVSLTTDTGNIEVGAAVTSGEGEVSLTTGTGNIEVGAAVTSGEGDVSLQTGTGNIEVGAAVTSGEGDVSLQTGTGDILVSGDITVGANKDALLEATKGSIYVGTFTDDGQTVSANGSIGAVAGNTAGTVTVKTGEGTIDILKSITSTNIDVENGDGNIIIGINKPSDETVTAKENISLVTKEGQIEVYGKTSTEAGDITMKAAAESYNDTNPESAFIIGQYGQVASGQDITLEGRNGDIHITDNITAQRNVNAVIGDKGSLYFDENLSTDGTITANVAEGDIEIGAAVTSGEGDVSLTTGTGNIEVGAAVTSGEGEVSLQTGTGNILVSGDITVGANKDALLEAEKGSIYVGTFTDDGQTVSANGSIGAVAGNTAGTVTVKTGEGTIDILKSITSTNIDVENGDGNIIIGINKPSDETVTAKENISLVTKEGQIEVYGKTSTEAGDITMKAAAESYNDAKPESAFIIGQYGQVASGQDITLEGRNGDIHITDNITAQRNVNAVIGDKGSLYFDENLSTDGTITATVGEGNIEIGAAVTAAQDVSLQAGSGSINVNKEVKSDLGAISVTTGNGNINIGDNGPTVDTVTAAKDVTLATELGKITVSGMTKSVNGDVTLSAKSGSYTAGEDGMNIIIEQTGRVEAGHAVNLDGGEGDLHISKNISSGEDLTAKVEGQGSLYFDTDMDVKGTIALATDNGEINVGHDVTAGESIQMQTDTGDISIGNKVTAGENVQMQTGTGDITIGNEVKANDSVQMNTVQGDISIQKTVTAVNGDIRAHVGQGDITIGDNGPTTETITAQKNISLTTDEGRIYVYGKTSTKVEDIHLAAANKTYAEGPAGSPIIIDHSGVIDSGRSVSLQGGNGDIYVTDEIKSSKDLDVKTVGKGNITFEQSVDSKGSIFAQTDSGNITASDLRADGSINVAVQHGDTNITLADAGNVSILMGDNTSDSSVGTIRANATGGTADVALGGNYISAGTIEAKNDGQYLVVFTQGATRGQASEDITIGAIRSSGGTIMPQVWSDTGSIYVAEGSFHASKVYALDNMRFANDKVSVTQYGKLTDFDKNSISYYNDITRNRPQDLLTDWFSGSYSDRRWLSLDLEADGTVRTRFGKLISSNGYRKLYSDSYSVADQMASMIDRWFPMGPGLVYYDRYGLIAYDGLPVNDDTDYNEELVANN